MKALISNPFLRWMAVVPGALLVAVAAMFPWHWVVLFFANVTGFGEEGSLGLGFFVRLIGPEAIERAGYGFFTSYILISVGAKIAPGLKRATAVVLSSMVVAVHVSFYSGVYNALAEVNIDVIPSLVATGLAALGAWAAWTHARPWWER